MQSALNKAFLFLKNVMNVVIKTFWKIETANAIFWMYLGGTAKKIFF